MPNKTTQILKEFDELWSDDCPEYKWLGRNDKWKSNIEKFITEALSQQQQEDYQTILDLELMKDEVIIRHTKFGDYYHLEGYGEYKDGIAHFSAGQIAVGRDKLRKELRKSIAEKRGKV